MIDYILCLIGIMIYFIGRYKKRTVKTIGFSFGFWVKDNWEELTSTVLMCVALMIIIHDEETTISFDKMLSALPFSIHVAAIPTMSFFIGLGLSMAFYRMFKEKTK